MFQRKADEQTEVQMPWDKWYNGDNNSNLWEQQRTMQSVRKKLQWGVPFELDLERWGHSRQRTEYKYRQRIWNEILSPDWLEGRSGWLRFHLGPEGVGVCVPCQEVWARFHGNKVHLWAESSRGRTGRCWEGIIKEKKYRQRELLGYGNNLSREEGRWGDASDTETTGSLSLFFLRFQRLWKHLVPQQMTLQF